jgi:hypothetical protein
MTKTKRQAPDEYRALIFYRQSVIARWLGIKSPLYPCLRYRAPNADTVDVVKKTDRAKYKNLQLCKRLWLCPVCSSRVGRERRRGMERAIEAMRNDGYALAFVTYTMQHDAGALLADEITRLNGAHAAMHSGRAWVQLERDFEWAGSIKACEVTYGAFSWHWHLHEIGFIADDRSIEDLQQSLRTAWWKSLSDYGDERSNEHALIVKRANSAVRDYVSKWGIVPELTSGQDKASRNGGVLPFQLPDAALNGQMSEARSHQLFDEYAAATKGIKQLWASPNLRKYFKKDAPLPEPGDVALAPLARLPIEIWREVRRQGKRAALLRAAENDQLGEFLDQL